MGFLIWLQETGLAQFLMADPYAYPILLCLHSIGMAGVVGLVWVMSARVLGYPGGLSTATFRTMSTIALWGFALNAVSGFLVFMTEATRVIVNTEFQLKMASIVIGWLAVWYMTRSIPAEGEEEPDSYPAMVKAVAVITSLAWIGAIFFGRQIAYTIKPPF